MILKMSPFRAKSQGLTQPARKLGAGLVCFVVVLGGCYSPERVKEYAPKTHAVELTQQAMAAVNEGGLEQALLLLNQAIEEDPGYPLPYKNKAALLGRMSRFQDAADALTELLKRYPADADAYLAQGIFHERNGNRAEAKVCYASALEKYTVVPEDPESDLARRLSMVQCTYLLNGRAEALKAINAVLEKYQENELARKFKYRILADQRESFLAGGLDTGEPSVVSEESGTIVEP